MVLWRHDPRSLNRIDLTVVETIFFGPLEYTSEPVESCGG
jgi:hypothetical protein